MANDGKKRANEKHTIAHFSLCVASPQRVVVVLGVTFFMRIEHGISMSSSLRVIPPGRHRELLSCSVGSDDKLSRFFMCSWGSLQGNSPEDRHPSDVRDGAGPRTLLLSEVTVESVTSVKFHDRSPALAFQGRDALDPSQKEGIACVSSEVLCCQLPSPLPLPFLLPPTNTHNPCPHNAPLLVPFPFLLPFQPHTHHCHQPHPLQPSIH